MSHSPPVDAAADLKKMKTDASDTEAITNQQTEGSAHASEHPKQQQEENQDHDDEQTSDIEAETTTQRLFFEPSDESLFITKYASQLAPGEIQGDFKTIPEDFWVSEVDKNGKIIVIENLVQKSAPAQSTKPVAPTISSEGAEQALEAFKKEMPNLPSGDYEKILQACLGDGSCDLQPIVDKSLRSKVHQAVRAHLNAWVVTETKQDGVIEVKRANSLARRQDNRRLHSKAAEPPFLHLTLKKRDMDLNHVLSDLAIKSRTPRKSFGFCGTKVPPIFLPPFFANKTTLGLFFCLTQDTFIILGQTRSHFPAHLCFSRRC